MIYGIGTDVCDIRRMQATVARWGDRFAQRVLGPEEWAVYQARSQRSPLRGQRYLATRFSAKEAFSKAVGLGIRSPMTWRACQIVNLASGQPVLRLSGELSNWFEARRLHAHVSVTDETDYAASFVVVEIRNPPP
jgi:holo-[acyl-carrier protein] synthase